MTKQAKQELSSTEYNVNQPREDLSMKICGTERRHQPGIAGNTAEPGQRSDCEQTADAGLQHKCQGLTGSLAMQQPWPVAFTNPHADPRSHHPLQAIPHRLSHPPAHPPKNNCRGHIQHFSIAPRRMQIIEFG